MSCFNPREIFCLSSSTRRTLTVISSPGLSICDGSDTRDQPISDTCSRPCTPPPRSTNAPNSRTETTRPVITAPATIDSPDAAALCRCCLLEQRAPRDDEILAAFLVLDDPEFVDAPYVRRRIRSGRCRSARTGRRRAGGRCAPRSRPSPRVRPCLRPEGRRGTRLRAAAASPRLAPASGRGSALRPSTPPSPECGRPPRPRARRRRPSVPRSRSSLRPCRRRRRTPPPGRSRRSALDGLTLGSRARVDASNIAAKSSVSSDSLTARTPRIAKMLGWPARAASYGRRASPAWAHSSTTVR